MALKKNAKLKRLYHWSKFLGNYIIINLQMKRQCKPFDEPNAFSSNEMFEIEQ